MKAQFDTALILQSRVRRENPLTPLQTIRYQLYPKVVGHQAPLCPEAPSRRCCDGDC